MFTSSVLQWRRGAFVPPVVLPSGLIHFRRRRLPFTTPSSPPAPGARSGAYHCGRGSWARGSCTPPAGLADLAPRSPTRETSTSGHRPEARPQRPGPRESLRGMLHSHIHSFTHSLIHRRVPEQPRRRWLHRPAAAAGARPPGLRGACGPHLSRQLPRVTIFGSGNRVTVTLGRYKRKK